MNCHSNAYMASWSTWNTSRASSWVQSNHTGPAVSGIIEVVDLPSVTQNQVYCLPHHCVLRHDKATTQQRIVNDASAKTTGPSLNHCLYSGHTFGSLFLAYYWGFVCTGLHSLGTWKSPFWWSPLILGIDCLRFLWIWSIAEDTPEIIMFRFTQIFLEWSPALSYLMLPSTTTLSSIGL